MAKIIDRKPNQKEIPQKVIVFGVNDPVTRFGWYLLAFLSIYGFVTAVRVMDLVGYKTLRMVGLTLYLILVICSISSEAPSIICRANRWVRTCVPLILFIIIYFTVFNFQTFGVSLLVLSIVFGLCVLVQLLLPIEGFYFLYVLGIIILGCMLAAFACEFDPKIHPFGFCFLTLFVFQMIIYFFNYPGPTNRAFTFY
ncbi:hypothetical protein CARUB_v10014696mg [Capsella rubella]|uniref:Uncharacterized protein n=1 Tax=Capsella rubella TaxID=81985 RepID=R0I5A5_9BRAS|nr:uncharacterized protein LOC17892742 [Capsella rubella]EOA31508.1 hypothetical protein CARUB_v10014696mg [Capsella rubella]